MALTLERSPNSRSAANSLAPGIPLRWESLGLLLILAASAGLNLLGISRNGYANTYYAAAVRSMLQNWHNFFFVSFDPGGFVSVDKPPLGYWIQTASAKLLGFHGWSILLPQALAGVGSVLLLYLIVSRTFGRIAGLIAAAAMALTPVAVADNRNNTVDSLLVFTLLLAAWAVLHAAERGRLRWLLLGMGLVGLGFNIKMLEAYLVLPALVAVYLLGAPVHWRTRFWHLAAGAVVLAAVSLSWAMIVDLTPASQRPYVGSSQQNSELELAFGYNGLQRLVGMRFPSRPNTPTRQPAAAGAAPGSSAPDSAGQSSVGGAPFGPPQGGGGPGFVQGGPSVLRLFDEQLGGQASWLLPAALAGIVAIAATSRRSGSRPNELLRIRLDGRGRQALLWGAWLLTAGGFFSVANFFHPYYLVTIAPPIAALTGAGLVTMWQANRRLHWSACLLPAAMLLTAAGQVAILHSYPQWSPRLVPVLLGLSLLGALFTAGAGLLRAVPVRAVAVSVSLAVVALLLTPAVWSVLTLAQGGGGGMPSGGPAIFTGFGMPPAAARPPRPGSNSGELRDNGGSRAGNAAEVGALPPSRFGPAPAGVAPAQGFGPPPGGFGAGGATPAQSTLISYLGANRGNARFLLAVPSSMQASPIIIQTGEPVMAMGGFSGGDPILTAEDVQKDVTEGAVRFFLLPGLRATGATQTTQAQAPDQVGGAAPPPFAGGFPGGPPGGPGGNSAAAQWVMAHCGVVPATDWQSAGTTGSGFGFGGAEQLYDCASHA